MLRAIVFLFSIAIRAVVGIASILVALLVLDNIHDRNTEIVVACLGLLSTFIFLLSRRWQYYGLTVFSLFGTGVARVMNQPYDQGLRDEIGLPRSRLYTLVTIAFCAAIELLCAFRLLTSLLGHGWQRVAEPFHDVSLSANLDTIVRNFLDRI